MPFYNQPKDQQEQEKYFAAADQPEVLAHSFNKPEEQEGGETEGHIFLGKPEDDEDGPEVEGHRMAFAKPEDEGPNKAH